MTKHPNIWSIKITEFRMIMPINATGSTKFIPVHDAENHRYSARKRPPNICPLLQGHQELIRWSALHSVHVYYSYS